MPEQQLRGSLRFLLALSPIVRCEAISGDETNPQSLKNFLVRRTPTYWRPWDTVFVTGAWDKPLNGSREKRSRYTRQRVRGSEVRIQAGPQVFFSLSLFPKSSDRLWGPPSLLIHGHRGSFPRSEADNSPPPSAEVNTLRTGSFKLFKRPFPGFLIILTL